MRFDRRDSSLADLQRQSRARVIWLLLALGLVIVGIQFAGDPASWRWLVPAPPEDHPAAPGAVDEAVVTTAGEIEDAGDTSKAGEDSGLIRPASDKEKETAAGGVTAGLDLSRVEDDTLWFSETEKQIVRTLLARLANLPASKLAEQARPAPTYGAVMLESEHYRGKIFEIQGVARRALRLPAEAGLPARYELWVFTRDSGANPWRVIAAAAPDHLPLGADRDGFPVTVTGLFFKRQGYETQDHALHVAPVLLAGTVGYKAPAAKTNPPTATTMPWVLTALVLGGMAISVWLWAQRRADERYEQTVIKRITKTGKESGREPAVEPETFLRDLENAPPADEAEARE